jgi:hypothetical protein
VLLLVVSSWSACARDPIDVPCPGVAGGELAVSEIRGDQTGAADALGQWIEIYNASGRLIDLTGLVVKIRKIDGSAVARIVVREDALAVGAGAYVVLGEFSPVSLPAHVDYGFIDDFSQSIYAAGAIVLESCGRIVDQAVYRDLPGSGSWAFDGARVPDALANDDESSWCADAEGTTHSGTPRAGNRPCL